MKKNYLIFLILCLSIFSCGKYLKPLPPEKLAPAEVKNLVVSTSISGVTFSWDSPTKDARGGDLKDLEGYRIYRKEIDSNTKVLDPYAKFDLIGSIEDTHLKELLDMREKASEQGQISRRITLPEERSKFQYFDNTVKTGNKYYYQIVAINQDGVDGVITERISISFRGELSQVDRIPYSNEDFDSFLN